VSGIWRLFAVEIGNQDTTYLAALLVELLLVGLSGVAAAVHATTRSGALRGATGALGGLAALGALFADTVLVT